MPGTFELSKNKAGQFCFSLLAANKRVILTSEAYAARASAVSGIVSVRKNAALRERFERRVAKNGKSYFVLLAKNGEIIGQSQMYAAFEDCDNGMESVGHHAPDALIVEE